MCEETSEEYLLKQKVWEDANAAAAVARDAAARSALDAEDERRRRVEVEQCSLTLL